MLVFLFVWLVGWFLNVLVSSKGISWTGHKTDVSILHATTLERGRGSHGFQTTHIFRRMDIGYVKTFVAEFGQNKIRYSKSGLKVFAEFC